MKEISKTHSLSLKLAVLVIVALAATLVCFYVLDAAFQSAVTDYRTNEQVITSKDEYYVGKLRQYVAKNSIAATDTKAINEWVSEQATLSLQIFRDDDLVYDSDYTMDDESWSDTSDDGYTWVSDVATEYDVVFADGAAEVAVYGYYDMQLYNYALIAALVISFAVMLLIVLLGIRKTVNYIVQLSREIEILEGGDLDYEITVKGKDELAVLAQGIDNMRRTFREQTLREDELTRHNQAMVTEMSHDLRTPLTSILLYIEILKNRRYQNHEEAAEYLEKIEKTVYRMKGLAENLLNYSIHSTGKPALELETVAYADAFYEMLSEAVSYLDQKGLLTRTEMEWKEVAVAVHNESLMRIFDNIMSNIEKYADRREPVVIRTEYQNQLAGFSFSNRTEKNPGPHESTGVGLTSMRNMTDEMGGRCEILDDGEHFSVKILLPIAKPPENP